MTNTTKTSSTETETETTNTTMGPYGIPVAAPKFRGGLLSLGAWKVRAQVVATLVSKLIKGESIS